MKGSRQMIKRDGHIHTPFCPHGSKDSLEAYVEEAIRLGREEMTFTEHFPLSNGVMDDPVFAAECALQEQEVPGYLKAVKEIQKKYPHQIKINRGFEVDFVEGKEAEIKDLLNKYGAEIEDSILSVHLVLCEGKYYCIDYEMDMKQLVEKLGSVEKVYDLYFETVLKSIEADLGQYKPKRIGHPSLVRIFNKAYPCQYSDKGLFDRIAKNMQEKGYEIDLNVAGLRKPKCGETYPSGKFFEILQKYHIPYVGGSDAHQVSQLALLSSLSEILDNIND